jgi:uncharacterized glyoxalase superfamily protein PhnB
MTKFCSLIPILNVRHVPTSIAYYVGKLGFKKDWEWGTPPTFASVSRDDICVFFCRGAQGQSGTWMSIFVEDVDALHEEYKISGATIRQPPTNFPWGVREMNIEDPDGHRIRMSMGTKAPADGVPLCED